MSAVIWMAIGLGALLLALFVYAFWIEPAWRLRIVRWHLAPPEWAGRPPVRIVVISDLHAGSPHISLKRVEKIVRRANGLAPDVAVLLGDYEAAHRWTFGKITKAEIIAKLAPFGGKLGRFAVLGNHDWWQDKPALEAQSACEAEKALHAEGIDLLDNEAVKIAQAGHDFWVVGLGDQRPYDEGPEGVGFDDLESAMAQVSDDAPVILLAHEPDLFPDVPRQCFLTLSGHTHGGQIRIGNMSPVIMVTENEHYSWGRYDHDGRSLIVSGGVGCSEYPVRLNMVPEITVIEISAPEAGDAPVTPESTLIDG